ncbi:MAG TPA: hypothetical protein VF343_06095 [Syntrophales bacterium]
MSDSIVERYDFLKGEKSCPLLPLLILPGTRSFLIITGALRIILKSLFRSMRSGMIGSMDFFRPYIQKVIYRCLDCGPIHLRVVRQEDFIPS